MLLPASSSAGALEPLPEPRRLEGDTVAFRRIYLSSPDGVALVRELSFEVLPGRRWVQYGRIAGALCCCCCCCSYACAVLLLLRQCWC